MNIEFCPLINYDSTVSMLMDINPRLSKTACKKYIKAYRFPNQSWLEKEMIKVPTKLVNHGLINPNYSGASIEIIEENNDFIAVNKPIKVHTHPNDYTCSQNILSYLASINKFEALDVNSEYYDRGVLYRLDFETSGIVILSKSNSLYRDVRDQFHNVAKKKIYLARVCGNAESLLGIHRHNLKSSQKKGSLITLGDENSPRAELEVIEVDYCSVTDQSLLKIELKTGLRHQIRFQLSTLNFPILGDKLYGGQKADRMYLHASEYLLETNSVKVSLKAGIPKEFEL